MRRKAKLALMAIAIALLVGPIVAALTPPIPPGATGVIVGTDVVFRPSQSWTDISFSSPQTFQREVSVAATAVTFDDVQFDARKLPQGLPRASILITLWSPTVDIGSTAISFTAQTEQDASLSFDITGLRSGLAYEVYVNGVLSNVSTDSGQVSFVHSPWPSRTFDLTPSRNVESDTIAPAQVTDLRLASWTTTGAVLQWTSPGDDGTTGFASAYDLRYIEKPFANASDFVNATRIPVGSPQVGGATETVNVSGLTSDTEYWFALLTSDEVPNWSPFSNTAQFRTLVTLDGLPTVDSISFNPSQPQLDVVFSEPMNRTSVENSLSLSPGVPVQVTWISDMQLRIQFQPGLAESTTYLLAIAPHAADEQGTPMARTFTFKFSGPPPEVAGTIALVILLASGVAGLVLLSLAVFTRSVRSKRKVQRLQRAMAVLARRLSTVTMSDRLRDLNEWFESFKRGRAPETRFRERRK